MKLTRLFAAVLTLIAISLPVLAQETAHPYQKVISELNTSIATEKVKINKWKFSEKEDPNIMDPNYEPKGWKSVGINYMFTPGRVLWFRGTFKMPEKVDGVSVKGSKAVLYVSMFPRGAIFINGKLGGFFDSAPGDALLSSSAVPGEEYTIVLRVDKKIYFQGALTDAYVTFSALDKASQLANKYQDEVQTVEALAPLTPNPDHWISKLDESAALIDLEACRNISKNIDYEASEAKFGKSIEAAMKVLEPFKEVGKKYTVYLVGYSHIDLAWLWDKHDGEEVWRNTSTSVLNLMNEYPDFIFNAGQAVGYQYTEADYPEIFEGIKKRVAEGRWETVGGAWVEHDGNVPSGEAYVRQYLYGKRYFQSRFGKDITVGWTPDSFGYNLGLPQILYRSGITSFLTQKINWNDTTKFPYNIFWWEGPDGSRVLTYFTVGTYSENNDSKSILEHLKTIDKKHDVPETLMVFGVGDHGDGVSRTHLNRAFSLKEDPIFPKIVFTSADDYFKHLFDLSKTHEFPTWSDELYLQYHRGTYTTQSDTKRNNRLGEVLQEEGEKYASIAATLFSTPYPESRIRDGWNIVLFNQFHDILPGSSITDVYDQAAQDYAYQQQTLNGVIGESLAVLESNIDTTGKGVPVVIFNPLSWKRTAPVEIKWTYSFPDNPLVTDDQDRPVPSQFIDVNYPDKTLTFVARDLPAGGYAVYHITDNPKPVSPETVSSRSGDTIESALYRVKFDTSTGAITSIFDKKADRELVEQGKAANFLQLYVDLPKKFDAWELAFGDPVPLKLQTIPMVVESGPVRTTYRFTTGTGKSSFTQYVSVYNELPWIDCRIDADWRESHVVAKLAFDLNLKSETAWFEIPYAAIERRAVPRTDEERAKYEVSGQKWIDYTDPSAKFGVSLLNNGKYGFDVKDNIMRMTMLRAPGEPDPKADRGLHTFRYALYPHSGDWRDAATPQQGYDYNYPPIARVAVKHTGKLPKSKSFFSAAPSNVILTTIKRAEDDDDTVIRVYETNGKDTVATITLPASAASVIETNLIEQKPDWKPAEYKISGNTITFPLGHNEIRTLKIRYKK